jgi:hypothetical protein
MKLITHIQLGLRIHGFLPPHHILLWRCALTKLLITDEGYFFKTGSLYNAHAAVRKNLISVVGFQIRMWLPVVRDHTYVCEETTKSFPFRFKINNIF